MMAIYGNTKNLYQPFLQALGGWNTAVGGRYNVYVGVRTKEEQTRLYDLHQLYLRTDGREGRSILAAKPGPMARHMYGLAADVRPNPVLPEHAALLKNFGGFWRGEWWCLLMDVPGEPWHIYPSNAKKLIESGECVPVHDGQMLTSTKINLQYGARGQIIRDIQGWALQNFGSYAEPTIGRSGGADGIWGKGFNAWLVEFCERVGLVPEGTARDAKITIGPKVWAEFAKHGFRTSASI